MKVTWTCNIHSFCIGNLSLYLKNYPKIQCHKTLIISQSMGQEFGTSSAGWFWVLLGSFMRLQSRRWHFEATKSEGLTGAGESISKGAHSYGWQAGAGCWQKASVSHHLGFSTWLLVCLYGMTAGLPQIIWSEREGSCSIFYELVSEVTFHYFHNILLFAQVRPI